MAEVFDDDLDLLGDVVRMEPDPAHDPLHGGTAFDFLLIPLFPLVSQLEGQLVGGVVLEHVQNEAFFDGLPHRIDVEGSRDVVRGKLSRRVRQRAEQFHRLGLRGRGERHKRDPRVAGSG